MENKTAQTNTSKAKRGYKGLISIIIIAAVVTVASVAYFLTFVPAGRAIAFAITNPDAVNTIAERKGEKLRNAEAEFNKELRAEAPKGQ